jgi:hypothetical protein
MDWILVGLIVLSLAGSYWLLRKSGDSPLCPACRIPSEPRFPNQRETRLPVFVVAYWCHRCGQVVSYRNLGPIPD